jgi:isopentenyldiphosphate isomerase
MSAEQGTEVEMVEEVDRSGNVMRLVTRAEMRRNNLRHRSVFIAVVSDDGDLLIHQRAEHKDLWPGWWDCAVGGVIAPGEAPDDAARRELEEELGVESAILQPLGSGAYDDQSASLIAWCYVIVHNGPFRFADGEVQRAEWVKPRDLVEWLTAKNFLPDTLALILPRLVSYRSVIA